MIMFAEPCFAELPNRLAYYDSVPVLGQPSVRCDEILYVNAMLQLATNVEYILPFSGDMRY